MQNFTPNDNSFQINASKFNTTISGTTFVKPIFPSKLMGPAN